MIKTLVELLQGTCFFVNDYEVTAEGGTQGLRRLNRW